MAGFGKIKGGISLPGTTALNSAVYGIYKAAEAEAYRKLGLWPTAPTVPGAPTDVSSVLGNAQALLTWSAPANNGGASITDYAIQYSSNNGDTWTAFTDSASTDTLATVTNLINDTAYIFRVAAVNAVGAGSYSAASNSVTPSATSASVEYLLVAGGGSGGGCLSGSDGGGGGGAGGLLSGVFTLTGQDTLSVVVGAGGACDTNGQNSVLGAFTAIGGGTGGFNGPKTNGANGGSGGGVGRDGCTTAGSGTVGQGNNGGNTACGGYQSAGGGGGAGEAGYDGGYDGSNLSGTTSKGGNGLASSITGTSTYYAGGGGGGYATPGTSDSAAQGGLGGGGNGGGGQPASGQNGQANTGGGGGGGRNGAGGVGGSGVAIVAYPATYPELAVAPSLTYTQPTRLGYRVYRFTAGSGLIAFQNQTSVPSAPTNLAFVPGNEQVSLSWTGAFSAGPSVSDYVIQYSSDDGISWTTFSDGTSTSTSATVTGLTNGTTYKFRVAAVNSIGTGDYSATVTGGPATALVITAQPLNDYATSSSQNITFSVTTSGGGTPTYQWQYYGADYNNNEYDYLWRNISGATSASYAINGNTASNLVQYDFYNNGALQLRCIVTAEGGATALTSSTVRFLQIDLLYNPYPYWNGSNGTYANWGGSFYTLTPQAGENLLVDASNYAMSYPDTSWYTGNDVTVKIQVATTGPGTGADWTDLYTQDSRGGFYISGYAITPSTGTKYYRVVAVTKWPYTTNNGTGSATKASQYVALSSSSDVVQVTWPTPPAAPTNITTATYDGAVALSWTAPSSSAAITDYVVQYSSNGVDWTTVSDGTSTNNYAAVSGLTNGTAYQFRVAAVSAIGTGNYGTSSSATPTAVTGTAATGGLITADGDYIVHKFVQSDSFVSTSTAACAYLVVGGGGGGGGDHSGGGGGGQVISGSASLSAGTYPIVIGAGGSPGGPRNGVYATNGGSTTFNGLTAIGGGGGGQYSDQPGAGGASGGGGASFGSGAAGGLAVTYGITGYNGAAGNNSGAGGGGGGGGNGSQSAGGIGISSSITGTAVGYGGGGGGADNANGFGNDGGGNGSATTTGATSGTSSRGGGGGGNTSMQPGTMGGSGVVVIRYPATSAPVATLNSFNSIWDGVSFTGSGTAASPYTKPAIGYLSSAAGMQFTVVSSGTLRITCTSMYSDWGIDIFKNGTLLGTPPTIADSSGGGNGTDYNVNITLSVAANDVIRIGTYSNDYIYWNATLNIWWTA